MKPWNKGRAIGQKKPLKPDEVKLIKLSLAANKDLRDLALFSTAIDTMLRSVDLLSLKVSDVTDSSNNIVDEFRLIQQKTSQPVIVQISDSTMDAIENWITESNKLPHDYLFTVLKGKNKSKKLSRDHYRELVKKWVRLARLPSQDYSSHSLRRTRAAHIYEKTRNIKVVQELLGQKSLGATSVYLGISSKEALSIAKNFEL